MIASLVIGFIGGFLIFVVLGWKPRRNSRYASRPKLTVIVNGRVWRRQTKNVHPIYHN
jgi:hypothetical protein